MRILNVIAYTLTKRNANTQPQREHRNWTTKTFNFNMHPSTMHFDLSLAFLCVTELCARVWFVSLLEFNYAIIRRFFHFSCMLLWLYVFFFLRNSILSEWDFSSHLAGHIESLLFNLFSRFIINAMWNSNSDASLFWCSQPIFKYMQTFIIIQLVGVILLFEL